jgi:hypothetical protein
MICYVTRGIRPLGAPNEQGDEYVVLLEDPSGFRAAGGGAELLLHLHALRLHDCARQSVVFGDEHAHCSAFAPIDIEGRAGADEFALQSIQIFGRYVELGRLRAGFDVGAEL